MSRFFKIISLLCILFCVELSVQLSLDEFLSLSQEQKTKLDKFRDLMTQRVPHDYMRKDAYLIRWLRDRDFNITTAQEHLLNHIQWRMENRMDSITQEDWADFDTDFPLLIEGCSRDGHLVLSMRVGDWDIRKYVLAGRTRELMRFIDKLFEEIEIMIRRMQEDGQNTTQMIMLFELSNFNLVQQGCAACLPIFFHDVYTYDHHYPGLAHKIISVNTAEIALPIWEIIKNLFRKSTREVLAIYGKNKSELSSKLLKEINADQLSRLFGGIKEEGLDMQELRISGKVYKCERV